MRWSNALEMKRDLAMGVTLYLGDCRDILPTLGKIDAVVTDPPYGQRQNTNITPGNLHSTGIAVVWPDEIVGDADPFDPEPWLQVAPRALFWGAHRFHERLPLGTWLVWDKVPTGKNRDQGDGEAAWLNDDPPKPMRLHRLLWDGVCVGSAARHEITANQRRVHPTQKPVALMDWCLRQADLTPGAVILDPYMGSGSTGIAAVRRGHPFIGIEIVPLYFETAVRRIGEALQQPDLFIERPAPATQLSWDEMWSNASREGTEYTSSNAAGRNQRLKG
jgi:site-specific DNA-methyltransferase (adenine-specific)